jgi:predicted amino acid-binding ACT domain protein
MKTLVLTFIAHDRPGLVEQLAAAVSTAGGNWLESRMARLAEKFAGIARVEISAGKVNALKIALAALEEEGFALTMEDTAADTVSVGPLLTLDLLGRISRVSCTISRAACRNAASVSRRWRPISAARPWAGICCSRPRPRCACRPG